MAVRAEKYKQPVQDAKSVDDPLMRWGFRTSGCQNVNRRPKTGPEPNQIWPALWYYYFIQTKHFTLKKAFFSIRVSRPFLMVFTSISKGRIIY